MPFYSPGPSVVGSFYGTEYNAVSVFVSKIDEPFSDRCSFIPWSNANIALDLQKNIDDKGHNKIKIQHIFFQMKRVHILSLLFGVF